MCFSCFSSSFSGNTISCGVWSALYGMKSVEKIDPVLETLS